MHPPVGCRFREPVRLVYALPDANAGARMTASTKAARPLERELELRNLELVIQTGLLLTRNLDLEFIVQSATHAGMQLAGAQFGAFFYTVVNAQGESRFQYVLSGAARQRVANSPLPGNTPIFGPAFDGKNVVRVGDITKDPLDGRNVPCFDMLQGHLPVRSYLCVPVKSQSGEVLGCLAYGHEQADVFEQESEDLIATVAAQAAVAIENARLREQLTHKIADLADAEARHRDAVKRLGEFAAIVESSDDAILSKDLNGIITSWNPAATRILGYTADEMIGTSILRIIPDELHSDEAFILAKIRAGEPVDHFETIASPKTAAASTSPSASLRYATIPVRSSAPPRSSATSPPESTSNSRSSRRRNSPPPAEWPPPSRTRSTIHSKPS